jgi:hypothetical protein
MVVDNLPKNALAGGREIIITTRLRLVAGVCVLSGGLFVGAAGGAVAWAGPDSEPASQSQPAEAPSPDAAQATSATPAQKSAPPRLLPAIMQFAAQTVTNTLRSIQKLGQQHSAASGSSATHPAASNTEASAPESVDPSVPAADPHAVASDGTMLAADSPAVPPATNPLAPAAMVAEPVAKAVVKIATALGTLPAAVMALPNSPTPVADAITTVQAMLTSVTDAVVPLVQLPSDLYTMLSVPTITATTTVSGGVSPGATTPLLGTRASQSDPASPIFLAGGMALPSDTAPLENLGDIVTTGLSNKLPASGNAMPAQDVIAQSALGSFLEHAVKALFVPASLSALAALALPGVGGLLIICGLGTRIGYRQAKALLEVRRAGIAVFAGPGPLGVVRAGSLIALRPRASGVRQDRALRVVRSDTSSVASLRDQAA